MMTSNYIDLVVARETKGYKEVFMLPAWSNAKPGDMVLDEDEEIEKIYDVLASVTIKKDEDNADHKFAKAMNGHEIREATALLKRVPLVWEEDEPSLEDEDGPASW